MLFDDPQFHAIYEDSHQFVLDGVTFIIRCKVNSFGVTYFPDAIGPDGEKAAARMLPWRNTFNDLVFVDPPAWLVNAIHPDYSMFTERQKATRREPAHPPELYIPLWELPEIQRKLRHWAREHPFIGRERDLIRSWKSRRGLIEVCKYALQESHHLEISSYDATRKQYGDKTRISGGREHLEAVGQAIAQVAGAREVQTRKKQPRKIIPFPE